MDLAVFFRVLCFGIFSIVLLEGCHAVDNEDGMQLGTDDSAVGTSTDSEDTSDVDSEDTSEPLDVCDTYDTDDTAETTDADAENTDTGSPRPCYLDDDSYQVGESTVILSCDTCDEICTCTLSEWGFSFWSDCTDCFCGDVCQMMGAYLPVGSTTPGSTGTGVCGCDWDPARDSDKPTTFCTPE